MSIDGAFRGKLSGSGGGFQGLPGRGQCPLQARVAPARLPGRGLSLCEQVRPLRRAPSPALVTGRESAKVYIMISVGHMGFTQPSGMFMSKGSRVCCLSEHAALMTLTVIAGQPNVCRAERS